MIRILVADASEVLENNWRVAEKMESDFEEHLQSPSFDWCEGTVVRVVDGQFTIYLGAYNETECVNIGAGSDIMESINPIDSMSLVEFWSKDDNAMWLIQAATQLVSEDLVIRALAALIKPTYRALSPWNIEDADVAVEAVINHGDVKRELERTNKIYEHDYPSMRVKRAITTLCNGYMSKNFEYYINTCGIVMELGKDLEKENARCSKIIREHIPFREIVVGAVRKR